VLAALYSANALAAAAAAADLSFWLNPKRTLILFTGLPSKSPASAVRLPLFPETLWFRRSAIRGHPTATAAAAAATAITQIRQIATKMVQNKITELTGFHRSFKVGIGLSFREVLLPHAPNLPCLSGQDIFYIYICIC